MIYKVTRKETNHEFVFIDAESELESQAWRDCQDYETDIIEVVEATPEELVGRIIEKDENTKI
jgi:hypothetical protein